MHRLIVAIVVVLALDAAAVSAQPDVAREHFEAAQKLFDAGEYLQAAEKYQAAYEAAPDKHALLYNIGLSYHRAGRIEQALANYERYLELDPQGAAVDEVREYVREFRSQLNRDAEEDRTEPEPSDTPAVQPVFAPEEPDEPAVAPGPPSRRGWWIGGGGVALLLAGIGTGLAAENLESKVEDRYNGGSSFPDRRHTRGRILNGLTLGFTIAGGAAVATGAIFVWIDRGGSEEGRPGVAIAPYASSGDDFGITASARF